MYKVCANSHYPFTLKKIHDYPFTLKKIVFRTKKRGSEDQQEETLKKSWKYRQEGNDIGVPPYSRRGMKNSRFQFFLQASYGCQRQLHINVSFGSLMIDRWFVSYAPNSRRDWHCSRILFSLIFYIVFALQCSPWFTF